MIFCPVCEDFTEHSEEQGDERACTECGNVTEYLDADSEGYFWRSSITGLPMGGRA